jgi:hypothetical protein
MMSSIKGGHHDVFKFLYYKRAPTIKEFESLQQLQVDEENKAIKQYLEREPLRQTILAIMLAKMIKRRAPIRMLCENMIERLFVMLGGVPRRKRGI